MAFVDPRIVQANHSFSAPAPHGVRCLLGCGHCRSLLGDQLVGQGQGLLRTTGRADVEAVFAIDEHGWYASDLVLLGQFLVLGDLALHSERVEGLEELGFINALGSNEVSHVVWISQTLAAFLDGVKNRGVNLLLYAHGVEGNEQLAVSVPRAAEHGRNTHEVNVGRQLGDPWVDGRLKGVAMRAAVPEHLHHFDLAWLGNRHGAAQLDVWRGGRISGLGRHSKQADSDQSGAEDQITHVYSWTIESPRRDRLFDRSGRLEFGSVTLTVAKKGSRGRPFYTCVTLRGM